MQQCSRQWIEAVDDWRAICAAADSHWWR